MNWRPCKCETSNCACPECEKFRMYCDCPCHWETLTKEE